ncbi:MAG: efflux RND transporter periplasmic adaptor subunit [Candidatus Moranbacteria bacterium]|nr:efflux RND transporter periplasmic adaptor subunit [Candidatus Moranbacteria bacterium]
MENNNNEKLAVKNSSGRNRLMLLALLAFLVAGAVALCYLSLSKSRIYVEKSSLVAPATDLSSRIGGTLQKLFVKSGDNVEANEPVAQIGNDIVKTKNKGIVISVKNNIGKNFSPGEAVVSMINPGDLRVVAKVEENKGLSDIQVGQKAVFAVDASGSKEYSGVVDEISPTARSSDIVFNISSAREQQEFNVKIRFSASDYPELKNGMSAKAWIYKD